MNMHNGMSVFFSSLMERVLKQAVVHTATF